MRRMEEGGGSVALRRESLQTTRVIGGTPEGQSSTLNIRGRRTRQTNMVTMETCKTSRCVTPCLWYIPVVQEEVQAQKG